MHVSTIIVIFIIIVFVFMLLTKKSCDCFSLPTKDKLMRKLWSDHVFWTREYIISAVNKLPQSNVVLNRLLKNQKDIASCFSKYGVSLELENLLVDHIKIAGELVSKLINHKDLTETRNKWYKNADDISILISKIGLDYEYVKEMMNMHLQLTEKEVVDIFTNSKDYTNSFDNIYDEVLKMADILSTKI